VDIAERKEEALKESERRFATVLANARAYVYRCRNEEGYPNEFASDYALELTGYPAGHRPGARRRGVQRGQGG
jgi:PAS domain-containing protein